MSKIAQEGALSWARRSLACALLILTACADSGSTSSSVVLELSDEDWVLTPYTGATESRVTQTLDGLGVGSVRGYAYHDHGHYVVDYFGDRVVRVDDMSGAVATIATRGKGPDEVLHPTGVAVAGDVVAVPDLGNGRLSFFHPRSDSTEHFPLPGGARSVAFDFDGGWVVVPDVTGRAALIRASLEDGEFRSFGKGRSSPYAAGSPYPLQDGGGVNHSLDLVATAGETAYVAQGHDGLLLAVDLVTGGEAEYVMPSHLVDLLWENKAEVDRRFPVRPAFSPLFAWIAALPERRLILRTPSGGDIVAFVVDLDAESVSRVYAPGANNPARSAVGFAPGPDNTLAVLRWTTVSFARLEKRQSGGY